MHHDPPCLPSEQCNQTGNGSTGNRVSRLNTAIAGPLLDAGKLVPVLDRYRDSTRLPIDVVTLPERHQLRKARSCADYPAKVYKNLQDY